MKWADLSDKDISEIRINVELRDSFDIGFGRNVSAPSYLSEGPAQITRLFIWKMSSL